MAYGKAEDAGGTAPAKDSNEAVRHFIRRTLTIFECVDYKPQDFKTFKKRRGLPAAPLSSQPTAKGVKCRIFVLN